MAPGRVAWEQPYSLCSKITTLSLIRDPESHIVGQASYAKIEVSASRTLTPIQPAYLVPILELCFSSYNK
jgi:hypothetical protein